MSTSPSSYVHRTTQTHSMLSSSNKSMFCLPEYFQVKNIQSHSFVSLFCLVIVDFDKHFIVLSQTMFTFSLNWKRILGYQCHLFNSMLNNILYLFGLNAECLSFVRSLSVEPCLSAMWVPSLVSIMQEEKMCILEDSLDYQAVKVFINFGELVCVKFVECVLTVTSRSWQNEAFLSVKP